MVVATRGPQNGILIRDFRAVALVNAERDRTHMSETRGETIGRGLLTLRTLEAHGIRIDDPEIKGEPTQMLSGIKITEEWVKDLLRITTLPGNSHSETVLIAFLKLQKIDEVRQRPRVIRAIGGIGPSRPRSQTHALNESAMPLEQLRSALAGDVRP